MHKIEIKEHPDGYKAIYADGILFDWGFEKEDIERAKKYAQNSDMVKDSLKKDIQQYLIDSFSEFLGKTVSLTEINESIKSGCIK